MYKNFENAYMFSLQYMHSDIFIKNTFQPFPCMHFNGYVCDCDKHVLFLIYM